MATATKKGREGVRVAGANGAVPATPALAFRVDEDNGGDHRWTIHGSRGETLARSVAYTTYDDAEQAARLVRDSAGAARLEGGSSRIEEVAKSPA